MPPAPSPGALRINPDRYYYDYDEEYDEYYCTVNMDEDEIEKFMSGSYDSCRYYSPYDEYKVVRKQN